MYKDLRWRAAALAVFSVAICAVAPRIDAALAGAADAAVTTGIRYADVQPIWDLLRPDLPPQLSGAPAGDREHAWSAWVRSRDAEIRGRVARGDEDTLVNLWLFGTSFTDLPPARPQDVTRAGGGATLSDVANERLDDLLAALASPRADGRLRWARAVLAADGIGPPTGAATARVRARLVSAGKRMLAEHAGYARVLEEAKDDQAAWIPAYATLYRDRGLSSDTSLLSSFAIDRALETLAASGVLSARSVQRVAIVGPGLDVINKADGNDFYPEQTIQPFTVIDSLIRHRLSVAGDLAVTTFDVSPRVNGHLLDARGGAATGDSYLLHLPLGREERWTPEFVQYWTRAGDRIGEPVGPSRPPSSGDSVKVRAVRVRPEVILSIAPQDLNIVLERLEAPGGEALFDLVVATNVFIYYDVLEQALAVMNIGRMLKPGASLLSNQAVPAMDPMKPSVGHDTVVYSDRQLDHVFWYQRR